MNYKDAVFELKHGNRLAHRGIVTPDGVITYIMNMKSKMVEVTQKNYQGVYKWMISLEEFEKNAKENVHEFEIY